MLYGLNDKAPEQMRGAVLAIGNFDGMHKGHRALIEAAKKIGGPVAALTFEPHPRQFFKPDIAPFRITHMPMKERLMKDAGVAHVFAYAFNKELAGLTAQEFIDRILVQNLGVAHVVVGHDFAFGRGRDGTVETLKNNGRFGVTVMPPVADANGDVYSSTAIRDLLRRGEFDAAAEKLGWRWQIESPIVHGDARGRTLGFPTANQEVDDYLRIPYGIYAVKVKIAGEDKWRDGAANFGIRPMFEINRPLLETFVFDFTGNLYGKILRVMPVKHLRDEKSFAGLEPLIAQMKEDCIKAKAVLESFKFQEGSR